MLKKPGVNMPNLQHSTAPGVGPNLSAMLAETQPGGEESKEDPDNGLTESSICNWKASRKAFCGHGLVTILSLGILPMELYRLCAAGTPRSV